MLRNQDILMTSRLLEQEGISGKRDVNRELLECYCTCNPSERGYMNWMFLTF